MTRQQTKDHITDKESHSKAFKVSLGILAEEIELAIQWNRPSILIAINNSTKGRLEAQQLLEKEVRKRDVRVVHIKIESANPDVIRIMSETPNSENIIFFISGIESADQVVQGKVYRALNIRRELLVEKCICVVFWVDESEAAKLPRLAPDFWAFRHRTVEFAPKRGSKNQFIPVGLFLWEERSTWMEKDALKNKIKYYEENLLQLPKEDGAAAIQIETILKLAQYHWLLNDLNKFVDYLQDGVALLEKYPIPHYQAWILNAKGIGMYEEGNKEDAGAHFIHALRYEPDNGAIMMNSSIVTHGLGRNKDAIRMGKQAINKNVGDFRLWHVLGYLFLSMGKIEEAIKAVTKARDISPESIDVHYLLAICYHKNEQTIECIKELSIAENKLLSRNAIQRAYAGLLGGKTSQALGQLKSSLEKGEVDKHHIRRDPNLQLLMNSQEFFLPDCI